MDDGIRPRFCRFLGCLSLSDDVWSSQYYTYDQSENERTYHEDNIYFYRGTQLRFLKAASSLAQLFCYYWN